MKGKNTEVNYCVKKIEKGSINGIKYLQKDTQKTG